MVEETKAANAEQFRDLIEINRAGGIDHLAYTVVEKDGVMNFAGKGTSDPAYVMRAIEALADVLDATANPAEFGHCVAEPPPRVRVSEALRRSLRADIGAALRDLAAKNDRGEIVGAVVVVCGPAGAAYRIIGSVPPRPTARLLREFCDVIEQESGVVRPAARLPAEWFDEE